MENCGASNKKSVAGVLNVSEIEEGVVNVLMYYRV